MGKYGHVCVCWCAGTQRESWGVYLKPIRLEIISLYKVYAPLNVLFKQVYYGFDEESNIHLRDILLSHLYVFWFYLFFFVAFYLYFLLVVFRCFFMLLNPFFFIIRMQNDNLMQHIFRYF